MILTYWDQLDKYPGRGHSIESWLHIDRSGTRDRCDTAWHSGE